MPDIATTAPADGPDLCKKPRSGTAGSGVVS